MSSDAEFQLCLAETLKWEGGYSDDAHDTGGKTMHGIIQREYDAYRIRKGLPTQWVKLISPAEEQEIYRSSYWEEVNAGLLPPGVDLVTWDAGVNSGPTRGIKWLQMALGVEPDGHMGQVTLSALAAANTHDVINSAVDNRLSFLRSLSGWKYFGNGWGDRCEGIRRRALAMADAPPLNAPMPVPHSEPDIQAAGQGKGEGKKTVWATFANSPSLRMLAHAGVVVAATVSGALQYVGNQVESFAGVVPQINEQADSLIAPTKNLAQSAGLPWGDKIGLAVVGILIVTTLLRQTGQKRTPAT